MGGEGGSCKKLKIKMIKFHHDGICGVQITQLAKDTGPWCYEFNEIHNTVLFVDLDGQRLGKKRQ